MALWLVNVQRLALLCTADGADADHEDGAAYDVSRDDTETKQQPADSRLHRSAIGTTLLLTICSCHDKIDVLND